MPGRLASRVRRKDRPKAEEALKLYRDTQEMLRDILENKLLTLNAVYRHLSGSFKRDDNIVVETESATINIPVLRQQHPSADGFCYSLADFYLKKTITWAHLPMRNRGPKWWHNDLRPKMTCISPFWWKHSPTAWQKLQPNGFTGRCVEFWGYAPDEKNYR